VTDNNRSQWTALPRPLSQQSGPLAPGLITAFQWESTASQNIGQLQKGERCRWRGGSGGGQGQRQAAGPSGACTGPREVNRHVGSCVGSGPEHSNIYTGLSGALVHTCRTPQGN